MAPDVPYTYDGRPDKRIGPTISQMPQSEFLDHRQLHGHAFQILDESMHFILRNIPIRTRRGDRRLQEPPG
jgi:hypothetical protein